jgi:cation diffusion facilitator family transporter
MHNKEIQRWQHGHNFNQEKKSEERRTMIVVIITILTMAVEIVAGWVFKSMALFADGCHMGTHATALGISLFAYIFARKYTYDKKYTFGTWKIEILGAYTSSILLGIVGIFVLGVSVERLFKPVNISYNNALIVAVIGLLVNFVSAIILQYGKNSHEHHRHDNGPHHHHDDLNLRSAYLHVIADALTSVFAIIALLGAKYFYWNWLDPFMGIVGSVLIFRWTVMLVKDTSGILLDKVMDIPLYEKIKKTIESDADSKVSDLHLWKVAQNKFSCTICIVASRPCSIDEYKEKLRKIREIAHLLIEINRCK